MPIVRSLKNVVRNYTPAEVKVREATCNDQWGPSVTLMNEIADLTNSSLARGEIMNMIWKRLLDTGKNWRHVIKALSLLEYIAKVGSPQVVELCKCHITLITMVNDFKFYENGVDYGAAIREKSKNFASLLRDSERFKNERQKALATRERLALSTGLGSSGGRLSSSVSDRYLSTSDRLGGSTRHIPILSPELEAVRPSSFGEEDLQLQLALAMSKEQHNEELKKKKGDDLKLKMAIDESKKVNQEVKSTAESFDQALSLGSTPKSTYPFLPPPSQQSTSANKKAWNEFQAPSDAPDPFNPLSNQSPWSPLSHQSDPFVPSASNQLYASDSTDPFVPQSISQSQSSSKDPWAPLDSIGAADQFQPAVVKIQQQPFGNNNSNFTPTHQQQQQQSQQQPQQQPLQQPLVPHQPLLQPQQPPVDIDNEFDMLGRRGSKQADNNTHQHDDLLGMLGGDFLSGGRKERGMGEKVEAGQGKSRDLVSDFLGENAKLVDLNQLITKPPPSTLTNPFSMTPYNPDASSTSAQPNYHLLIPNLQNNDSHSLPQSHPFLLQSQTFNPSQQFPQQPFNQSQPFFQPNQNVPLSNGKSNINPFL